MEMGTQVQEVVITNLNQVHPGWTIASTIGILLAVVVALIPIWIRVFRDRKDTRRLRFNIFSTLPPLSGMLRRIDKDVREANLSDVKLFSESRQRFTDALLKLEVYYQQGILLTSDELERLEYLIITLKMVLDLNVMTIDELNNLLQCSDELSNLVRKNIYGKRFDKEYTKDVETRKRR